VTIRASLIAPFSNQGGYGHHSRSFGDALQAKADVVRFDLGDVREKEQILLMEAATRNHISDAPCILLAPPSYTPVKHGSKTIFYTVWETSILPPRFVENLDRADEIWVPTEWGAAIIRAAGIDSNKVRVVPEGVDVNSFKPCAEQRQSSVYRFLYVGKWEERKGTVDLLRAFSAEFKPSEPVVLTMHFGHDGIHGRLVQDLLEEELARIGTPTPSISISTRLPAAKLVRLIQLSDAFVLPTRSEGWGLPILEAMACALPCIVTNYSGHLTYANSGNSYLIDVREMRSVVDHHFFPNHVDWGTWAQPDISHLRSLMRHVFENRDEARQKGQTARIDAMKWSWTNSADVALGILGRLS
jgi:glycosyltransferase involved in cell wall biosynthesis